MIKSIVLMLVMDFLVLVFSAVLFLHCSGYLYKSFKGKGNEQEKDLRESKEFLNSRRA